MSWPQWLLVVCFFWPVLFCVVAALFCGCGWLRDEVRR